MLNSFCKTLKTLFIDECHGNYAMNRRPIPRLFLLDRYFPFEHIPEGN